MQPQHAKSFSEADLLSAGAPLCYIYTLHASNDPECRPRYVGFTCNPKKREKEHNGGWELGRKGDWTRALLKLGHKAVLVAVFTFRSDDIAERAAIEATWIESYRLKFSDLLNDAGGGSGIAKTSDWARRRNSESKKKNYRDNPDKAKRHSEKMKAHYRSPEARKKSGEASKRSWTEERRKKFSERSRKYWSNPENRKRKSKEVAERYKEPEARKKHSQMLKARFAEIRLEKLLNEF